MIRKLIVVLTAQRISGGSGLELVLYPASVGSGIGPRVAFAFLLFSLRSSQVGTKNKALTAYCKAYKKSQKQPSFRTGSIDKENIYFLWTNVDVCWSNLGLQIETHRSWWSN
jgi:hypothetical protein